MPRLAALLLVLLAAGCSQSANVPDALPASRTSSTADDGELHAPVPPGDDA